MLACACCVDLLATYSILLPSHSRFACALCLCCVDQLDGLITLLFNLTDEPVRRWEVITASLCNVHLLLPQRLLRAPLLRMRAV